MIFVTGPLATLAAIAVAGPLAGLVSAALPQTAGVIAFVRAPAVRSRRGRPALRHRARPLRAHRLVLARPWAASRWR
nr:hypothetical protein [uncultured Actinoplanes sp.]